MKNFLSLMLFCLTATIMYSQPTWSFTIGSCIDGYDYCLVAYDQGEPYYPVMNARDTSYFRIFPDTVQVDRLNNNYNDGQQSAFVGIDSMGQMKRCPTDSVFIPWSQITQKPFYQRLDSLSGTALQTSYVITHGLPYTPSSVFIQARTPDATERCYISAITSTTFTITFISAPVVGTNNIVFDWAGYR